MWGSDNHYVGGKGREHQLLLVPPDIYVLPPRTALLYGLLVTEVILLMFRRALFL